WADWWQQHRDGFQPPAKQPAGVDDSADEIPRIEWPEPLSEYCGMPIYAKRVVFVIDHSSSMAARVDGVTRLQESAYQLKKAIDNLDRYAYFNVITHNESVQMFQPELVPADEDNKKAARAFISSKPAKGATATYDALMAGLLSDSNVEAMYYLSDGEPSKGPTGPPLLNAITAHNAIQRTSIITLGIDSDEPHREFLRDLAHRNAGQFKLIRTPPAKAAP
ncbi:MAG TPA: VWA domain-containing protein, partial [Planctomycetaceae bacterium]|nr:VWA domain-containing protein [Planctomycetaceae bacterium]